MHKKAHTLVSGSAPVAPEGGSTADQHVSQRNMRYTHTTRLHPALQDPTPHVSDHPLASSGHTRRSPASSPQQQLSAHAPAARAAGQGSQTGSWPFPHSPTAPLHLNTLRLGPRAPPPRPCPQGRNAATSWSKKRPIAPEKASPPDVPSGANRATDSVDLQRSNAEVNTASCANHAMGKGPGSSATPVSVAAAAVQGQKRKAVSGASNRARALAGWTPLADQDLALWTTLSPPTST